MRLLVVTIMLLAILLSGIILYTFVREAYETPLTLGIMPLYLVVFIFLVTLLSIHFNKKFLRKPTMYTYSWLFHIGVIMIGSLLTLAISVVTSVQTYSNIPELSRILLLTLLWLVFLLGSNLTTFLIRLYLNLFGRHSRSSSMSS
jgi:hypothetical protein